MSFLTGNNPFYLREASSKMHRGYDKEIAPDLPKDVLQDIHKKSGGKGEYDYDVLVNEAEEMITKLDMVFNNSDLPTNVSMSFCNELILKIRKNL